MSSNRSGSTLLLTLSTYPLSPPVCPITNNLLYCKSVVTKGLKQSQNMCCMHDVIYLKLKTVKDESFLNTFFYHPSTVSDYKRKLVFDNFLGFSNHLLITWIAIIFWIHLNNPRHFPLYLLLSVINIFKSEIKLQNEFERKPILPSDFFIANHSKHINKL